jgi:hypothetical protein
MKPEILVDGFQLRYNGDNKLNFQMAKDVHVSECAGLTILRCEMAKRIEIFDCPDIRLLECREEAEVVRTGCEHLLINRNPMTWIPDVKAETKPTDLLILEQLTKITDSLQRISEMGRTMESLKNKVQKTYNLDLAKLQLEEHNGGFRNKYNGACFTGTTPK